MVKMILTQGRYCDLSNFTCESTAIVTFFQKEEKFPSSQTFSQFNRLIIHYFFLNFKSFFHICFIFYKKSFLNIGYIQVFEPV